ncbi:MAG: hypothetical protein Q8P74_01475 [bacterium]|nr:hypothetical protein [bacterium]
MKKTIAILILISLISPSLSLAQTNAPQTMDEAKEIGEQALERAGNELPGTIKQIWQNEIFPVWLNMWNWIKAKTWPLIESWITPEYEKRKQYLEENFDQEKEEIKEEIKTEVPKVTKSLWEKFKELIK